MKSIELSSFYWVIELTLNHLDVTEFGTAKEMDEYIDSVVDRNSSDGNPSGIIATSITIAELKEEIEQDKRFINKTLTKEVMEK